MSTITEPVIDSLVVIQNNSQARFYTRIYRSGSALDLTGMTVTATIRPVRAMHHVLHSTYEDMAVTLGNADTTAANGGTDLTVTFSSTYFFTPPQGGQWEDYYLIYDVTTIDYKPAKVLIHVARSTD